MDLQKLTTVKTAHFIDLRTNEDYQKGHIKNAINIPLEELPTRSKEIQGLTRNAVVLYCYSGIKSGNAVKYLHRQGFENIFNGGGYEELSHHLKMNSICSVF